MATNSLAHKLPEPHPALDITRSPLLFIVIVAIVVVSIGTFLFFHGF